MTIIIFSILSLLLIISMIYMIFTQNDEPRTIVVYSGSFNPIHIGHKAVIDYLSKKYDWVYLIVTPQNPLKDKIEKPIENRIEDVTKALLKNEYFNVTVNAIENTMQPPYYTINTLRKLQEKEPNNKFKLVIGADCLLDIRQWKSYDEILSDFGVIIFPRDNITVTELEIIKSNLLNENHSYQIDIINIKTPNISSTEIRNAINNGNNVNYLLM